jgi:hypothetical protein
VGSAQDSAAEFERGNWGWGIFYGAMAITDVFLIKSLVKGGAKLLGKGAGSIAGEVASKEAIVHAEKPFAISDLILQTDKAFKDAHVVRKGVKNMSKATGFEVIKLKPGDSLKGALAKYDKITLSGHGVHSDELEGAAMIAFGEFGNVTPKQLAEILNIAGFKGDIRLASCRTGMPSTFLSTLNASTFGEALKIESGLEQIVTAPIYDIVYGLARIPQVKDVSSSTIPKALLPLGKGWLHW